MVAKSVSYPGGTAVAFAPTSLLADVFSGAYGGRGVHTTAPGTWPRNAWLRRGRVRTAPDARIADRDTSHGRRAMSGVHRSDASYTTDQISSPSSVYSVILPWSVTDR